MDFIRYFDLLVLVLGKYDISVMSSNEPTLSPVNIFLQSWLIVFTLCDPDNDDISPGITD